MSRTGHMLAYLVSNGKCSCVCRTLNGGPKHSKVGETYYFADLVDFFDTLLGITNAGVEVLVRSVFDKGLRK